MKSIHSSLALALGFASALATPAFAQAMEPVAAAPSSGLLGKRYVEASLFLVDYKTTSDDGYGLGTVVNLPLAPNVDAGASFQHNWFEGDTGTNFQDLAVYVTAYADCGDFRPFAKATLAHEWWHTSNDFWYQFDVGSEYLVTERFSVSARATWSDYLASEWDGGVFGLGARANYWLTSDVATSATLTYTEDGTWVYGLAVVFQF